MKKFKILAFFLTALIAAASFVSCSSDDDDDDKLVYYYLYEQQKKISSSTNNDSYSTADLIGRWTSNSSYEDFSEMIFEFLDDTQVRFYDGETTETCSYTLKGNSITIETQPDCVKSIKLVSKTEFEITVLVAGLLWVGTYTKQ